MSSFCQIRQGTLKKRAVTGNVSIRSVIFESRKRGPRQQIFRQPHSPKTTPKSDTSNFPIAERSIKRTKIWTDDHDNIGTPSKVHLNPPVRGPYAKNLRKFLHFLSPCLRASTSFARYARISISLRTHLRKKWPKRGRNGTQKQSKRSQKFTHAFS